MTRKWGQDDKGGGGERDAASGRFVTSILCDACGKPMGNLDKPGNHYTDDEVCGGSDGPGFYLCHRVRCGEHRESLPVEERRALYTAQRAKNKGVRS